MQDNADVVIVGGGAIGSAVACFLAAGRGAGRIVIVERDNSYSRNSTARSAGGLRQQFSTPENIRLSPPACGSSASSASPRRSASASRAT